MRASADLFKMFAADVILNASLRNRWTAYPLRETSSRYIIPQMLIITHVSCAVSFTDVTMVLVVWRWQFLEPFKGS